MSDQHLKACIPTDSTLAMVLENLNGTGYKISLVIDSEQRLLGIVTDWDVRTALLNGLCLTTPVTQFMNIQPMVGKAGMSSTELRDIMLTGKRESLPVVDDDGKIVKLALLRDFVPRETVLSPMVIMAGGQGKRLWPLTLETPKPLLTVAERPILGHILNHIHALGFGYIKVVTHYKSEMIESFLEEETPVGLNVTVLKEENPLGTAGSLRLLTPQLSNEPLFVMNGDILTTLDFQNMLEWHMVHNNIMTIGARYFQFQVPYGVLETDGQKLLSLQEKPVLNYNINAGIYLIQPAALDFIPPDRYFDMTDLIEILLVNGQTVGTFPISEPWIDIGRPEDYTRVNEESHQYLTAGV